jgi:hypothetical protein
MGAIRQNTAKVNPMTANQSRHIYFLLKRLNLTKEVGDEMCPEWTNGRAWKISELQFIDAMNVIKYLNGLLQNPHNPKDRDTATMDRKRKGLIKAVFRWYELQGKVPSMEYVKGTICKAGSVESINDLTETDLQRLYAEFCRKQKASQEMNNELEVTFSNN